MPKVAFSLKERALSYLARREHSRQELRRKLLDHAGPDEVDSLLDELQQCGWLSDARYVEQVLHARGGKVGHLKLAYELRTRGVKEELVQRAVSELQQNEIATARALWQKKFGTLPASREEWARQARYLQGRGFDADVIRKVLSAALAEDDG